MNTKLTVTTMRIPAAKMNGESSLPSLRDYNGQLAEDGNSQLGYDEGLFVGYGKVPSIFPYRMQDMYTRELYDTDVNVVILENKYLKAVFYPDYGGKLAALTDKVTGRDPLLFNPVIRPCNLALRNAWMSGGVEFNCGIVGHHPYTCSRIFTAQTKLDDGTPVLRFYEFERIRKEIFQMDFFLPEDSKLLFARMKVINTNPFVTPAYWWSNMAVPEAPGSRVIVPADSAYTNLPDGVNLVPIQEFRDIDVTFPINNPKSVDYFFKIPDRSRKYETQPGSDGYGLVQTSTSLLRGRKQFVWGQGPGGDRWQSFLTKDNSGIRYVEIQAGLAHSQYEHLPMPPRSAWEWLEGYGALQMDPAKVAGSWDGAKAEAEAQLDALISDERMEEMLLETKPMSLSPAEKLIFAGSGWGALENERRKYSGQESLPAYLDFGSTGDDQEFWTALLEGGKIVEPDPDSVPASWMLEPFWIGKLEAYNKEYPDNWYAHMQLGMAYLVSGKHDDARRELEASVALTPSAWSYYGLSKCATLSGESDKAAEYVLTAAKLKPDDVSVAREAMKILTNAGMDKEALALYSGFSDAAAQDGRVTVSYVKALLGAGQLDDAEKILLRDGGVTIADIREGENSLTDMWFELEEKKAALRGEVFDRSTATPPASIDFRMTAIKKK